MKRSHCIICSLILLLVLFWSVSFGACAHKYGTWRPVKKATCEQAGEQQRTCTKCGTKQVKTIAKLGHKFNADGVCKVCKKANFPIIEGSGEAKPTCKHNKFTYKIEKSATCTESGIKKKYCKNCNQDLGTQKLEALGHKYGNYKTIRKATCILEGVKTRECKRCKAKETIAIKVLEHKFGNYKTAKPATCTTVGEKVRECKNCGLENKTTIPAKGHNLKDGVCKVCGFTQNKPTTAVCKHQYTPATCTAPKKCKLCGVINGKALGHNYDKWKVTKEATCIQGGIEMRVCVRCKTQQAKNIDKLEHKFNNEGVCEVCKYVKPVIKEELNEVIKDNENVEEVKEVIKDNENVEEVKEVIKDNENVEEVKACEHKRITYKTVKNAMCVKSGEREKRCQDCNKVIGKQITKALGHSFNNKGICKRCGTKIKK